MGHGTNVNWTELFQSLLLVVIIQQITCDSVQFSVPEELEPGTPIGSLTEHFSPPYQLLTREFFQIDINTGTLTAKEKMDREVLCPEETKEKECIILHNAVVGPSADLIQFSVIIIDINDNPPHFVNSEIHLKVPEDVSVGTSFLLDDQATDMDAGVNGQLRYHLHGSGGVFEIKVEEEEFTIQLVVQKPLDREIQDFYLMYLVATDCGYQPLNASAALLINVTDVNDNCPSYCADSPSSVSIQGDSPKDTLVTQVRATDADIGQNADIVYSLSPKVSQRAKNLFSLNGHTGHIRLAEDLRSENSEEFVLKVLATGPHCPPAVTQVTVSVLPKVNQEFTIKIRFIAEHRNDTVVLPENQPPGVLAVLDLEGDSSFKDFSLAIEGDALFSLSLQNGKYLLTTSKSLDYEMKREHNISVVVHRTSSEESVILSSRRKIKVQVTDVNDNPPHFSQSQYQLEVEENNQPGTSLLRVSASDADSGDNGRVTYKLHTHTSAIFNMDSVTGQLSVLAPLDREQQGAYRIAVLARDSGSPPLESEATVIIHVLDQNDNAPVFLSPHFIFFIPENTPPLAAVGKLEVKDPDEDENVRLQVVNSSAPFVVDNTQGTLRSTTNLDREAVDRHELYISASDNGHPIALTSITRVTVFVEDVNDNQPKVILPASNSSCLTVSPSTTAGTMVTKIYAIDEDSGLNSEITYSVVTKEPIRKSPFLVDSRSGNVTLSLRLLHKDLGMHHLFVVVRDSGKPTPLYTTVWINLLVNESSERCYLDRVPEWTWSPDLIQNPSKASVCETNTSPYERVTFFSSLGFFLVSVVFTLTTCIYLKKRHLKKKRRKVLDNDFL